jgi:hypothetical protein
MQTILSVLRKGQMGDADMVFDLTSKFWFAVGPVSNKRWGDGGPKALIDRRSSSIPLRVINFTFDKP